MSQNLHSTGIYSWFSYVKHIVEESGMDLDTLKTYYSQKITKNIREQIKLKVKHFCEKLVNDELSDIKDKSKHYL